MSSTSSTSPSSDGDAGGNGIESFPPVAYRQFLLGDIDAHTTADHPGGDPITVQAGPRIQCFSAGTDFTPHVTVYWHQTEPATTPGWDHTEHRHLDVTSGTVAVAALIDGPVDTFELTPGRWQARIQVRGRDAARTATANADPNTLSGLEEWRFDLWPE